MAIRVSKHVKFDASYSTDTEKSVVQEIGQLYIAAVRQNRNQQQSEPQVIQESDERWNFWK